MSCGAGDLGINYDNTKPDGQFRKDVSNEKMMKIMPDFEFTDLSDGLLKTFKSIS